MERRHFKLAQGYLNIDADALIFTRSGNWQEAEAAQERSTVQQASQLPRILTGVILVVVGGLFFGLGKLRSATGGGSIVLALGLAGLGIFKMYQLLNDDFGPVFRIPFAKVQQLKFSDDHLVIDFLDASFKPQHLSVLVTVDAGIYAEGLWNGPRKEDRPRR
ncbi:MAG: hypothetical protein JNL43_14245 [Flavobacteriales bacterium]|nr:hypothetical protein [Flavobacteriales bacterium]